ncbi:LpqB family beta-propeller domain-containing protein [Saccharothrix syringae]|uniref:GerMN domain-containing protein n=1 Tax=Saccharothrix syringae TaxID=103733 RepID=A0A5Q0HB86_SACSY|nr:LpqB family beta-propeller domain-containing protein [Saccharothrix syringae]QFZ23193.1 hypothetical protein EKG83_42300 [Saccharothrix syringae]
MRLLAAVLVLLLASGCAAIPTSTSPIPVNPSAGSSTGAAAPEPAAGIDPLTLVREFVNAAADPDGDYAAAKAYLTDGAKKTWNTKGTPTIIDSTFNTVPAGPTVDDDKRGTVLLQGKQVGRLLPEDNSFIERVGAVDTAIGVERDGKGEWRISSPPEGIYVTQGGFNRFYRRVTLYFWNTDFSVLVPDPRYVVIAPSTSIPHRVMQLLLKGPAVAMRGALATAIPNGAEQRKDTVEADDGALQVDLTKMGDITAAARKQVVAQVVKSMTGVSSSRIRVLVEGDQILAERRDWRSADVTTGESLTTPDAGLTGMLLTGGRVRHVDGAEVPGPAGSGEYQVVAAAQSMDGNRLAVVNRVGEGSVRLRVGGVGEELAQIDLTAASMTRPTWLHSGQAEEPSGEVWTVVDGTNVVRVVRTDNGWSARTVNASELGPHGTVTELRLSRDGSRVAAVAGGRLLVAAVVRGQDGAVTLRSPRNVQPSLLGANALGLDWLAQDVIVVSTSLATWPIAKVNIDGLGIERYNTSNLTAPVTSVTAAPGRNVLAVDGSGLWTAGDVSDVWRSSTTAVGPGAQVFYPG